MLTDFGVAKILESDETMDQTGLGVGIGTPEYMAPEQWEGKEIDGRADIYALGVVFYELITSRVPFKAETVAAIMVKAMRDPLPHPSSFVKEIPGSVERIIFKALARDVKDRYLDMELFAQALEKIAYGQRRKEKTGLRGTKTISNNERTKKNTNQSLRQNHRVILYLVGAMILLAVISTGIFWNWNNLIIHQPHKQSRLQTLQMVR